MPLRISCADGLDRERAVAAADGERCRRVGGHGDADDLLAGREIAGLIADRGAVMRVRRLADLFRRDLSRLGTPPPSGGIAGADAGLLLAYAYPDRIGRRRGDSGRYLLANGRGAAFSGPDGLSRHEFLVIADLDAGEREARIHLAAPVALADLAEHVGHSIVTVERVAWDRREAAVVARREQRLGAVVLEDVPLRNAAPALTIAAMLDGVRELGIEALPWSRAARTLQTRIAFVCDAMTPAGAPSDWPDLSDGALTASLEDWLAPYLDGITRRDHLSRLDLVEILGARLDYAHRQALERLAPTHFTVPSGSRIPIDYGADPPRIAVRLQEVFGLATTPKVADGRVALALELLSPAQRPVQVTRDLESFWTRGYAEVRKELKGRYPKHHWPEDPRTAQATARARPR